MWTIKNSKRTGFRYAYDVELVDRKNIMGDRYLWTRYREVSYEAENWCEENCSAGWSHSRWNFSFDSKDDATMFKLTWAGQVN